MNKIIGAHLYFGAGPLNWLNSLTSSRVKADLAKVKEEGFTDIFLLIPWAEILYDDGLASASLKFVLSEAKLQGLNVSLRICYLWESGITEKSTYQLLHQWPYDSECKIKLNIFLEKIKKILLECEVKAKLFCSWEDLYWPIYRHWEREPKDKRIYLAEVSGYNRFISLINANDSLKEIPSYESQHSILFASFFDNVIIPRFLAELMSVFNDIGFEYRVDSDHVGYLDPLDTKPLYYHWNRSQPFASEKLVYFHQNLGGNRNGKLTSKQAINNFNWLLRTYAPMRNFGEMLPLIDQFNFVDTTEAGWASLVDDLDEMKIFLSDSLDNIEEKASGIVLWGYENWPKDIIFNGSFNYGLKGWEHIDGGATIVNNTCELSNKASIQQILKLDLPKEDKWKLVIDLKNDSGETANVLLSLGSETVARELPLFFDGAVEASFIPNRGAKLNIACIEGSVKISKIQLYDRIYSQGGKINPEISSKTFDMLMSVLVAKPDSL